jgi:hypothetical protein
MKKVLVLLVLASSFLVVSTSYAKKVMCVGMITEKLPNQDKKLYTQLELSAISTKAGTLDTFNMTVFKTRSDMKPEDAYKFHITKTNVSADQDQKTILAGWKNATGYLISGAGCFGSSYTLIMPNNLQNLRKGLDFKTEIREGKYKAALDCTMMD